MAHTVGTSQRTEHLVFLVLALFTATYVIARAALVPWVHDECASLYWFVERGEFLPFQAHWDANNHVLSSAIGTAVHRIWGLGLFLSRVGSVLAFFVYAWAVFNLGKRIQEHLVRWCLWAALMACPFAIEFFSLFRGYGLELAFWAVAIEGLLRLTDAWRTRYVVLTLCALLLANAAVLALLPLWAMVVTALGVLVLWKWRSCGWTERIGQSTALLLLGVAPLLFGVAIAFELRDQGLLYHGSTDGFRAVTVSSLIHYVFALDGPAVQLVVILSAALATLAVLLRAPGRTALVLVAGLLWLDVLLRISMAEVLGVNYPKDRAAIHFIPLFILLLAFALDTILQRWPHARWIALFLLSFPLRTLYSLNVSVTSIWPEQSINRALLEAMATPEGGTPAILGAHHQLQLVVPYGARLYGLSVPPVNWEGFPGGRYDRWLVDDRVDVDDRAGYHPIATLHAKALTLLERDLPQVWQQEREFPLDGGDTEREFMELWRGDTIADILDRVLDVQGALDSQGAFTSLELVVTVKDATGSLYYQPIPFALERPIWNGEKFRRRVRIPALPGATSRVVYIWNVHQQAMHYHPLRVNVQVEVKDTLR